MRILRGASISLLLWSCWLWGCTEQNPVYCGPEGVGCADTTGDGDTAADLGSADDRDLRGPAEDLRPDVIYVNNRGGACSGEHAGTMADPLCGTTEALKLVLRTGRRQVYVFGSAAAYAPLQIDGLTVAFAGPGGFVTPTARIEGRNGGPALAVSGAAAVSLDGFELGPAGAEVVSCQGDSSSTPALAIQRSRVHDGQESGVYSRGCKLSVSKSVLYANGNRGVNAESGGEVLIENSLLAYNRGGAARVSAAAGRVRFSTLVYNGSIGSVGGVECTTAGGQKLVEGTILYGNARGASGSQLSLSCRLQRSAIDEEPFANGGENRFRAAPDFVSNQDFRLRRAAGSSACCIDQLDGVAGVSDVTADFEGTARPQGRRWDIGAHEVR